MCFKSASAVRKPKALAYQAALRLEAALRFGALTVSRYSAVMVDVASMVLFAADLERTADFYRLLGIALAPERHASDPEHDDGPAHAATELGPVHFAVYEGPAGTSPGFRTAGSTFAGFYVDSLDDAVAAVAGLGSPVLVAHEVRPWGCRAIVTDPDGRAVEVNQRNHCG